MAFNHFVRFLMEHEPKRLTVVSPAVILGVVCMIAGLASLALSVCFGLFLIGLSLLMFTGSETVYKWKASKKFEAMPEELKETWELLRWMALRRELNQRTHPQLRALLEEIAEIRRTTLDALGAGAWKERVKTAEGARAVADIESVLQDALYDAIFIGRYMFRQKGQRESTYLKQCSDEAFGKQSLESIGQIRDEMRLLSESALAAGEMSDLRVNLVKARMDALVAAEREVEEVSSFDATE